MVLLRHKPREDDDNHDNDYFISGFGFYAYLDGDGANPGDTAILVSPVLQLDTNLCITFWYMLYGADVESLQVITHVSRDEWCVN